MSHRALNLPSFAKDAPEATGWLFARLLVGSPGFEHPGQVGLEVMLFQLRCEDGRGWMWEVWEVWVPDMQINFVQDETGKLVNHIYLHPNGGAEDFEPNKQIWQLLLHRTPQWLILCRLAPNVRNVERYGRLFSLFNTIFHGEDFRAHRLCFVHDCACQVVHKDQFSLFSFLTHNPNEQRLIAFSGLPF